MESCAESDKDLLILDRPNPNGFSVDGPILDPKLKSGIGMFPMPITHGMTIGELARMYNGEGWLANHEKCKITIIPVANYSHNMQYILPVAPSPNLNTQQSVWLYPSLCLFEGTIISQGRGTHFPFTVLGNPELKGKYEFSFTPVSIKGMAETPLFQDKMCYGLDLRNYDTSEYRETGRLILKWLIEMYQAYPYKEKFFDYRQSNQIGNFDKLAGTTQLKQQIISGKSEEEIRDSWEPGLSEFKKIREKYLLYSSGPNDENKVRQIVSLIQARFAPDHRTAIDQVEVTTVAGKIILKGITDIPVAKKALLDSLGALKIPFADSVKVLPDSALGDKTWGLVALSVANLRGGPGHANELVSQALMGTPLMVLQYADGWYRVQTPDYYIGWMEGSGIQRLSEAELNQWKQSSRYVFNRISGNAFESPDEGSLEVSDLVLGDLFVVEAAVNGFLKMQTPDGRTGYVRSSDCLSWSEWTGQKPVAAAVIAVARKMLGMPYLWGGTSTKSVDCSGLTKTAYFSQGIILARDASQQARYGEHPDFSDFHNLQPGDLLFFGRDEQHVTHVALYMGDGKYIHSSGLIRINSLDPDDPKYDATLKKKLLGSARVLNSLNTEGITLVKDHPWYSVVNQK
jgi:SH3-like domain-containing protein